MTMDRSPTASTSTTTEERSGEGASDALVDRFVDD